MGDLFEDRQLNRRQFLRIVGFSSGGIALAPLLSAAKPSGAARRWHLSRCYQAAPGGRLLGSADGSSWASLASFGPHLAVTAVKQTSDGWVVVTLSTGDYAFMLKSRDEKTWYTLDFETPDAA